MSENLLTYSGEYSHIGAGTQKSMSYPIESNVPIPSRYKYPFNDLEVGDSFFVPNARRANLYSLASLRGKQLHRRFITKAEAGGVRVWRVA